MFYFVQNNFTLEYLFSKKNDSKISFLKIFDADFYFFVTLISL